jgi:hypothetical protein
MADGAHREILAAHPGAIEARTVRIESTATRRPVAVHDLFVGTRAKRDHCEDANREMT